MPQNEPTDHDIIIELRTQMRTLVNDVKEIKYQTTASLEKLDMTKFSSKDFADTWGRQIIDHEARLRRLEDSSSKGKGGWYVIISVVGFLASTLGAVLTAMIIKSLHL